MDAFLDQFESGGMRDSQGVFTIDAQKAQVKLAQYRLASLDQLPIFLLAAGDAAGASELKITFPSPDNFRRTTRLEFLNWKLSSADLHLIGMSSLKADTPVHLKYLAAVLSTLSSLETLDIRSEDFHVRFEEGVMVVPDSPQKTVGSLIVESPRNLREHIERGLNGQDKFCRMRVTVAGLAIDRPYRLSSESLEGFVYFYRPGPGLSEDMLGRFTEDGLVKAVDEGPAMMLGLALPFEEAEMSGFWLLHKGLVHRTPRDFAPPGFFGVAVGDQLRHDLSYNLVIDDAYYQLKEEVKKAAQLVCGRVSITRSMLTSHRLRSLPKVFEALDLFWVEPSPQGQSAGPVPAFSTFAIQKLINEFPTFDDIRKEALLIGYRKNVRTKVRAGKLEDALIFQRAENTLRNATGLIRLHDKLIYTLLLWVTKTKFEPLSPEFVQAAPTEFTYLNLLRQWCEDKRTDPAALPSGVDDSWLYPTLEDGESNQPWARLMRLLEKGEARKALVVVQSEPSLRYELHQDEWLEYFWSLHRGKFSWPEVIALRVKLSFASKDSRPPLSSSFHEAVENLLGRDFHNPPIWPRFLTLLHRASERQTRTLWTALYARTLLDRLLTNAEMMPLSEPFSPEPA